MNIFALSKCPFESAILHCDKHVVKMIVESAQMLSTAHRLLDGEKSRVAYVTKKGKPRKKDIWRLDSSLEKELYLVAHPKHPSTVWTCESDANYIWHYTLFTALCDEYTFRYGKVHKTDTKLRDVLFMPPENIPTGRLTPFALAMKSEPQCADPKKPIESYRKFYMTKQNRFKMVWSKRSVPKWFKFHSA